jgi:hypothetical protein
MTTERDAMPVGDGALHQQAALCQRSLALLKLSLHMYTSDLDVRLSVGLNIWWVLSRYTYRMVLET